MASAETSPRYEVRAERGAQETRCFEPEVRCPETSGERENDAMLRLYVQNHAVNRSVHGKSESTRMRVVRL